MTFLEVLLHFGKGAEITPGSASWEGVWSCQHTAFPQLLPSIVSRYLLNPEGTNWELCRALQLLCACVQSACQGISERV